MRILHLVATLDFGGVERMVTELALEQQRTGHQPAVCCLFRRQGGFLERLESAGIQVFGTSQPLVGGARRFIYLRDCLRQWPAEIVFSPLNYSVLSQVLASAAARPRRAFVVSQHSMSAGPWRKVWKVWLNGHLAWPFVAQFTAASKYAARRASVLFGRPVGQFRIIYNGVRPEQFRFDPAAREAVRAELGLPPPAIVWGSVGSLERVKGFDILLTAFVRARQLNPNLHLVIVGSGSRLSGLQQAAIELKCEAHVTWAGASRDVSRWLSAFDHYVQPSRNESFGIAPLEALANGLRVVASHIGGLAEIAEQARDVTLTPPEQPSALGDLMAARSSEPPAGRESRLPAIFDLATVHRQYLSVFDDCLRRMSAVRS